MLKTRGFTLAELLIALAILGVIAAFTIPKVLQSQQGQAYKAAAKEAASIISGAYQAYKLNNTASASTSFVDMTGFINHVTVDTAGSIDSKQTDTSIACNTAGDGCLRLHNGGALYYNDNNFAGTATTNALELFFDPDGVYGGTTDGPGKSVNFFLYFDGRLVYPGYNAFKHRRQRTDIRLSGPLLGSSLVFVGLIRRDCVMTSHPGWGFSIGQFDR